MVIGILPLPFAQTLLLKTDPQLSIHLHDRIADAGDAFASMLQNIATQKHSTPDLALLAVQIHLRLFVLR